MKKKSFFPILGLVFLVAMVTFGFRNAADTEDGVRAEFVSGDVVFASYVVPSGDQTILWVLVDTAGESGLGDVGLPRFSGQVSSAVTSA
jgi:hypothetical protein